MCSPYRREGARRRAVPAGVVGGGTIGAVTRHDGLLAPALVVRRWRPVPSRLMMYRSDVQPAQAMLANTSCEPSGDQAGEASPVPLDSCVRFVRPEPSAFISQMSWTPARLLANASCEPSGDQAGCASGPGLLVSRVSAEPSAFIT